MAKTKDEEVVVAEQVEEKAPDLKADYVEVGYTQKGANTVPGGRYIVNGVAVNAHGEPVE